MYQMHFVSHKIFSQLSVVLPPQSTNTFNKPISQALSQHYFGASSAAVHVSVTRLTGSTEFTGERTR